MTAILHKLSPQQVRDRIDNGGAVLIDIRETDEFARSHVRGAQSHPLSTWEKAHLNIEPKADVIFTCRSGMRTAGACDRLAARVNGDAFVLDGGLDAWAKAGLPVETNADAPMEIMRQVQIAAGSLAQIELYANNKDGKYKKEVYVLPKSLDEKVARLHLKKVGAMLTELSDEQAAYIGVPKQGPYKPDTYRY